MCDKLEWTVQEENTAKDWTLHISIIFRLVGIALKVFYYSNLHVWSDLISVRKMDEEGNKNFDTEFTWLGKKVKKVGVWNRSFSYIENEAKEVERY